jgi:hypothetical protein
MSSQPLAHGQAYGHSLFSPPQTYTMPTQQYLHGQQVMQPQHGQHGQQAMQPQHGQHGQQVMQPQHGQHGQQAMQPQYAVGQQAMTASLQAQFMQFLAQMPGGGASAPQDPQLPQTASPQSVFFAQQQSAQSHLYPSSLHRPPQ